jgi:hypothetical protein
VRPWEYMCHAWSSVCDTMGENVPPLVQTCCPMGVYVPSMVHTCCPMVVNGHSSTMSMGPIPPLLYSFPSPWYYLIVPCPLSFYPIDPSLATHGSHCRSLDPPCHQSMGGPWVQLPSPMGLSLSPQLPLLTRPMGLGHQDLGRPWELGLFAGTK